MKLQDIIFFVLLVVLFVTQKPRLLVLAGLLCLFFAIPLFASWTFFTAERLTWYAASFFLIFCIIFLYQGRKVQ